MVEFVEKLDCSLVRSAKLDLDRTRIAEWRRVAQPVKLIG